MVLFSSTLLSWTILVSCLKAEVRKTFMDIKLFTAEKLLLPGRLLNLCSGYACFIITGL